MEILLIPLIIGCINIATPLISIIIYFFTIKIINNKEEYIDFLTYDDNSKYSKFMNNIGQLAGLDYRAQNQIESIIHTIFMIFFPITSVFLICMLFGHLYVLHEILIIKTSNLISKLLKKL